MSETIMNIFWLVLLMLLLLILPFVVPSGVSFSETPNMCTNNDPEADRSIIEDISMASGTGPIETTVVNIKFSLYNVSRALYQGMVASGLTDIFSRVVVLYITLYGLMVAMGMLQVTYGEALGRLIKLAIVAIIMSPAGFDFFYGIVGRFFIEGADQFVNHITTHIVSIASGGGMGRVSPDMQAWMATYVSDFDSSARDADENSVFGRPFATLDIILKQAFSIRAIRFYLASFVQPIPGFIYILLMFFGIIFFIGAVGSAIWVYLLSLVVRLFLVGLAPIFLMFMLFRHTSQYFDAWLKQMISFSLQPILLFMFLTMISIIIDTAIYDAFDIGSRNLDVCLQQNTLGLKDSEGKYYYWWTFKPIEGMQAAATGGGGEGGGPLRMDRILIFFTLSYMSFQFINHIATLATELTQVQVQAASMVARNPFTNLPAMFKGATLKTGVMAIKSPWRAAKGATAIAKGAGNTAARLPRTKAGMWFQDRAAELGRDAGKAAGWIKSLLKRR